MKLLRARHRSTAAVAFALAVGTVPAVIGSPAFFVASTLALCLLAAAIAVHDLASLLIPDRYTAGILVVALADWWFEAGDCAALVWRIGLGGALMLLLCLFGVA